MSTTTALLRAHAALPAGFSSLEDLSKLVQLAAYESKLKWIRAQTSGWTPEQFSDAVAAVLKAQRTPAPVPQPVEQPAIRNGQPKTTGTNHVRKPRKKR